MGRRVRGCRCSQGEKKAVWVRLFALCGKWIRSHRNAAQHDINISAYYSSSNYATMHSTHSIGSFTFGGGGTEVYSAIRL